MAPRPQWKGHLKLSLVTCSVALYTAVSSSHRTRFNILNRATGHRVRRQLVDATTAEIVDHDDQVKGFEVGKDSYVVVENDEVAAVALESTHTIDIDRFVQRDKVDRRYLDTVYYLAPNDAVAQQAFAVIRDAMSESDVVGLARIVMSRRERVVMLEPFEQGMLVTALRYADEVRDAEAYFSDIEPTDMPKEMLELARHIIKSKLGSFDLSRYEDRYEKALVELIRDKQKGSPVETRAAAPRPSNVVDLMQALRQSLSGSAKPASRRSPAKKSAPRKRGASSARGRMKRAG